MALRLFKKGKTTSDTSDRSSRRTGLKSETSLVSASSGVLVHPHTTEKATNLHARGVYVFIVRPEANKIEVKKAVEKKYGVKVVGVTMVNLHPKERRLGRFSGWVPGVRKAMVRIQKGQTIDLALQ